jgi:hypothetical protein
VTTSDLGLRARGILLSAAIMVAFGVACAPSGGGDQTGNDSTRGAGGGNSTGGKSAGGSAGASGGSSAAGGGGGQASGGSPAGSGGAAGSPGSGGDSSPPAPGGGSGTGPDAQTGGEAGPVTAMPPSGGDGNLPNVDRADNKERAFTFKASDADPAASKLLGTQQAFLDTRTAARGVLVVHLHGSGEKVVCGYTDHGKMLANWGFHVFMPCYDAAVSWSNSGCGDAVGDCRLEMLDGTDHSAKLNIPPPESVEGRITHALMYLVKTDPKGDWGFFLAGDKPRWDRMIISGQSFGATSALLIAKHRPVVRAIGLSGPLDGGAAWLKEASMTPVDRMYAFSQVNDGQHPTHMSSMGSMGLPGSPVEVEASMPPYMNSHRLVGATKTYAGAAVDGHNATEARMQSPRDAAGKWLYEPVWRYMYGVPATP